MSDTGWRPIGTFRGQTSPWDEQRQVDIWVQWSADPLWLRPFGDAFRVANCWKKDGKWFHRHDGKELELNADYITHWMRVPQPPKRRSARAMTKRTRTLTTRRDRRKAKQSNWRRSGKSNPRKKGHGGSGEKP